jgi:hypothetical protein
MEADPASIAILGNLQSVGGQGASLAQMKMWLVPQKAENEHGYNINRGYFEMLLANTLRNLMQQGYVRSTLPDGMEDGDAQLFSLTDKGIRYLEEIRRLQQAAMPDY